jgi:hypothetical protein
MRKKLKKITKILGALGMSLAVLVTSSVAGYASEQQLTEEKIARIKEMAKENDYLRDVDDFESEEAYKKYLEFQGISCKDSNNAIATYSSVKKVEAKLGIKLKGLKPDANKPEIEQAMSLPIQTFYMGSSYVYIVQKSGSTVYLSRMEYSTDKKEATFKDKMILKKFGHCQTLQYFEWKNKPYFLMTCKDDGGAHTNEDGRAYYWATELARVQYEPKKSYDYMHFKRLCQLSKANTEGTAIGTPKRCDGALSSDKKTLLVWCKTTQNKMQFARYNLNDVNKALDNSDKMYVSCGSLKEKCLASYTPSANEVFGNVESSSMQGLELNDANNTYIANGANSKNKYIIKLGKTAKFSSAIGISNSNLVAKTNTEIEGLQLKGDNVYFGICNHNEKGQGIQYIYYVSKNVF